MFLQEYAIAACNLPNLIPNNSLRHCVSRSKWTIDKHYKTPLELGRRVLMSCNVLLVEDEPLARRNITHVLQRATHSVHEAASGEAALDLINRLSFNSVISDLRLPGRVNGLDVLKYQNAIAPGTRLLLITAFGSDDVRSETEAMGALYMEKPLKLSEVLSFIERPS
jgi:DNA-binding NtrC family response regulator